MLRVEEEAYALLKHTWSSATIFGQQSREIHSFIVCVEELDIPSSPTTHGRKLGELVPFKVLFQFRKLCLLRCLREERGREGGERACMSRKEREEKGRVCRGRGVSRKKREERGCACRCLREERGREGGERACMSRNEREERGCVCSGRGVSLKKREERGRVCCGRSVTGEYVKEGVRGRQTSSSSVFFFAASSSPSESRYIRNSATSFSAFCFAA